MMNFIWANKHFIWINQFKTKYVIQRVNTSLRISGEIPHTQLSYMYLKVIDLDNTVLCGGWRTYVNDRFQDY